MKHNYDDIIHLSRPISRRHRPMPLEERAAQFSPFAALSGFSDVLKETRRLTEPEILPDDEVVAEIDRKLQYLREHLGEGIEIAITYFIPDTRKSGGQYVTVTGEIARFYEYEKQIKLKNGCRISIDKIRKIE